MQLPGIDPPLSPADIQLYRTLPSLVPPGTRMSLCGIMPPATENRMYERVLLGHGCVYFTRCPDDLEYGARITDIRDPAFIAEWAHTAPGPTRAFTMRTREFLRQLCADEPLPLRLFPTVAGARAMLDAYDAMQAELPHMRRCLRPPPRLTAEFEAIMCAHWAPLISITPSAADAGGVRLTAASECVEPIKACLGARTVACAPFMWSTLFHVVTSHTSPFRPS